MKTQKQLRNLAAECFWTSKSYRKLAQNDKTEVGRDAALLSLAAFNIGMAGYYEGRAKVYKEISEEL